MNKSPHECFFLIRHVLLILVVGVYDLVTYDYISAFYAIRFVWDLPYAKRLDILGLDTSD